jgi:hypothetical protein
MDGRDTQGRTHDKGNEKENGRADAAAGWARNRRGLIGTHLLKARHGSSNRSGHKRLVFRVPGDVVLHKGANRNDSQVVLARIFQRSMSQLRA